MSSDEEKSIGPKLVQSGNDHYLETRQWLSGSAIHFFRQFEETAELIKNCHRSGVPFVQESEEDAVRVKYHVTRGGRFALEKPTYVIETGTRTYKFDRENFPACDLEKVELHIEPGGTHPTYFVPSSYEID